MPREKPLFRENLDRIDARFPNKDLLTYQEVADYIGKSKRHCQNKFKYNALGGIPKTTLARALSEEVIRRS